ncbi:MAG: amino acid deaminase [Enterobacteriaceae bacterium]
MKYHDISAVTHKSAIIRIDAERKYNVLQGDICLPAALIKHSALQNNLQWMQHYADSHGVALLPHGKTTMSPQLFQMQVQQGAWGISVGTAWQAKVAVQAGVRRVVMVNQLVGAANMALVAQLMRSCPELHFYCCVDSLANGEQLSQFFSHHNLQVNVLLELGVAGKRCGCRTIEQAQTLALALAPLPGVRLAGVELYEGVLHGDSARPHIEALVQQAVQLAQWLGQKQLLATEESLLTGSGTSWFDMVAGIFAGADLPEGMVRAIRPGCYITHDQGVYAQAQEALLQRDSQAQQLGGNLQSALEVIACVQSVPEPGLAVIGLGKRDASFDEGLPCTIAHFRDGQRLDTPAEQIISSQIMDQHLMVQFPAHVDLQVGDLLAFAISHPCLTFDKWRILYLVDEQYRIVQTLETCF